MLSPIELHKLQCSYLYCTHQYLRCYILSFCKQMYWHLLQEIFFYSSWTLISNLLSESVILQIQLGGVPIKKKMYGRSWCKWQYSSLKLLSKPLIFWWKIFKVLFRGTWLESLTNVCSTFIVSLLIAASGCISLIYDIAYWYLFENGTFLVLLFHVVWLFVNVLLFRRLMPVMWLIDVSITLLHYS